MSNKVIIIAGVVGAIAATLLLKPDSQSPAPSKQLDTPSKTERVEHYEKRAIASAEAALQILKDENSKIEQILTQEKLDTTALEHIHEISYSLESAIDKMIADKSADSSKLEAIDEAVQALHYASEKHEVEKTRTWFTKLKASVDNLGNVETATPSKEKDSFHIVIKNHKFTPETTYVPADKRIKLIVDNQDITPEEFESHDMGREKIISGNSKATIFIGPLKPGKYHYFGEFNMDSANGYIIAQ